MQTTSETKHTPTMEKWSAASAFINNEPNHWIVKVAGWGGRTVCDCGEDGEADAGGIARTHNLATDNAALIAALKALLSDYERCKKWCHDNDLQWVGSPSAPDWQARAAIERAEGGAE